MNPLSGSDRRKMTRRDLVIYLLASLLVIRDILHALKAFL
jgi:hypothetical protein